MRPKFFKSTRHASSLLLASSIDKNQFTFKHLSLRLPLNDSIWALSVSFPGLEKSSFMSAEYTHASRAFDINTGPLSTLMRSVIPRSQHICNWYNKKRIKMSLGAMIQLEYSKSLGFAVQLIQKNIRTPKPSNIVYQLPLQFVCPATNAHYIICTFHFNHFQYKIQLTFEATVSSGKLHF